MDAFAWIVEQAKEEIKVRTRPQHEVVIRHEVAVIPLACPLPVPEGLPHAASRNGNTELPVRAIAAGGAST